MSQAGAPVLPDARPQSLVLRLTPPSWLGYVQLARLDRPAGWQMLLAPGWWAVALAGVAQHRGPNLWHLALMLVGAVVMRGAGCAYNDVLDRDLDAQVERTRARPMPSGRVGVRQALAFTVALSLAGFCVLIQFNLFTIFTGVASLAVVALYPLAKRVTSWPQAVLGLAFSWGALVGWSATFASLSAPAFLLYAAAFCWTVGYDTVYALQDARDDAIVGIRSTARLFGAKARLGVAVFYALAFGLAAAAVFFVGSWTAMIGPLAFGAHLAWQVWRLGDTSPANALMLFRANRDAGVLMFAGLALAGWLGAGG